MLDRSQAYLGVLIDDLVTLGTKEPYRLFTSRAEYRLLLREDNADRRLMAIGHRLGLVSGAAWEHFCRKERKMDALLGFLQEARLKPRDIGAGALASLGSTPLTQAMSLAELLRRPEVRLASLLDLARQAGLEPPDVAGEAMVCDEVEIQVKYAGYIRRQEEEVLRFKKLEHVLLPPDMQYQGLPGLSNEVVEKLNRVRPRSLGQAARISGITPAAISVLQVHLKQLGCL